jgi:hypothetical protein
MSGGNPVGNSEAAGSCLHPHHPLRRAKASVVLFLR